MKKEDRKCINIKVTNDRDKRILLDAIKILDEAGYTICKKDSLVFDSGYSDSKNYIFRGWYNNEEEKVEVKENKQVGSIAEIKTNDGMVYTQNTINGQTIQHVKDLITAYTKQLATWEKLNTIGWDI